jgi:hypothetical protein
LRNFGKTTFFLRGSVIPFPVGVWYRQEAILLKLLGITFIITPPYYYIEQLSLYLALHSLLTLANNFAVFCRKLGTCV